MWLLLPQQMLLDKPEKFDELPAQPPIEPPAQPLNGPSPDPLSSGLQPARPRACAVGYGVERCSTYQLSPYACYSSGSGSGEGLNGFCLDCKSTHPAVPEPSEEVLAPFVFRLVSESHLPSGEPPNEPMQQ